MQVLDTEAEKDLDDIVRLASHICETPVALISLLDRNRQWFKARLGVDACETARELAFCSYAILQTRPLVVEDATLDPRFSQNPLVTGQPGIRFYAGAQLQTEKGFNIGTLCVIDLKPRSLSRNQIEALEILSHQVVSLFERRKLKSETSQQARFLAKVMDVTPNSVGYIDREFRFRYANRAYEERLNIAADQLIGKPVRDLVGEQNFQKAKPLMELALAGAPQNFEMSFTLPNSSQGSERATQCHYIPDRQESGEIKGFFVVSTDVSSLRQAETVALAQGEQLKVILKQSQASEQAFASLFNNAPVGMIQVDSQLRFISANPAFQKLIGYEEAELKRMSIFDITHPDHQDTTKQLMLVNPKPDIPIRRFERKYLTKSGKTLWALVTSRAAQHVDGGEYFMFSIIEDITETRRTTQELAQAQTMLLASAKMASLGEMAGGVAHEINNPLAIIYSKVEAMHSELIEQKLDYSKLQLDLALIKKTVGRIAKIVKSLRSFSRNSNGDPTEVVSLEALITDTMTLCRERFRNGNCELLMTCTATTKLTCRPTEVSQILVNLLNNSFEAISSLGEKWVKIDATQVGGMTTIKVTDSGHGIEPQVVEKMMEPFFTTKDIGFGTGLGLSLSKGIAEAHGGKLSYSIVDGHTCFTLEIPTLGVSAQFKSAKAC